MTDQIAEGKIKITLDGSGVKSDVAETVNSIDGIGRAAEKAGAKGSKGIEKLADGAQTASSKIDRATNNIKNSIERTIATINAGGRGTSTFFEALANTRGADPAILKPYIDQLKAAEKAAEQAALSNAKLGNTAKQTAFALRNVPAQVSDIFVSLQAGQAPLTVFLQQGAQLKDLFGGAGNAARALGGYLIGLINPVTLLGGAVAGLGAAYYAGSEQINALNRALVVSGNIVGNTKGGLDDLVQQAGRVSGSYGTAREAVEALASSGQISGRVLETALTGVISGAQLTGREVKDLVKDFESIGKSPVKSIVELNQRYNFLTLDIFKQIQALEKQGRTQEAATLAANLYANTLNNRNTEIVKNLGYIEKAWKAIKDTSSAALNIVTSFGRESSLSNQLAKAKADLKFLQDINSKDRFNLSGDFLREQEALVKGLESRLKIETAVTKATADRQAQENKRINSREEFDKLISDPNNLSKKQAEESKIAEINRKFDAQLRLYAKGTDEYKKLVQVRDQAIANVREKASAADNKSAQSAIEKLANAFTNAKDRAEDFIRTQKAQLAQETSVTAAQKLSAELLDLVADKKIKLNGVEQKTIESYAQQILKLDELNIAREQELKFYEDFEKALVSSQNAFDQQIDSIAQSAEQLELENSLFGKLPSAITEVTIARLKDRKAIIEGLGLAADDIERQIEAYERLRAAQTNKEFLEKEKEINEERKREAKRVADDILRTNERMAENINRSLTDALLRGFESGKSFAKNFRDTLVNMFKTLVLRPIIDVALNSSGITKLLTGVSAGLSGNALASTGGTTGANSILGQLSSIGDIFKMGNSSIVSSIESLGAFIANGNGGILDSIGGFIGANSNALADGLGYAGAVLQLAQGNIGGGLGAAIGTTIAGPIGGAIGSFLGGAIGGLFGGKNYDRFGTSITGIQRVGGQYTQTGQGIIYDKPIAGVASPLNDLNKSFTQSLSTLLKGFDIEATIGTYSAVYQRGKSKKSGGIFNASIDGLDIGRLDVVLKSATMDAVFKALVDKVLGEGLVKAIQKSKLPESIKSLFDGLTKQEDVTAMINATSLLNQAQDGLINKFGISRDKAVEVAKATGLVGNALSEFIVKLSGAGLTLGDALNVQRQQLIEDIGGLPANLRAFDELLKGIDKSSAEGVKQFTDLFNIRDQFISYTNSLSSLRSGVDSALLNIVSDGDKQAILQRNLARAFDEVGLAIPSTIEELISLGQSIDFTTAAGLNLASVFPNLVSAFTQTQEVINGLTNSLRTSSTFATAEDFNYYNAVSAQYGGQFASDFTANLEAARIVNDANGKAIIEADPNASIVEEVKMLRSVSEYQAISLNRMAKLLEKFDVDGLATRVD